MAKIREFEKILTMAHRDELLPKITSLASDLLIHYGDGHSSQIEDFYSIKESQYFVKFKIKALNNVKSVSITFSIDETRYIFKGEIVIINPNGLILSGTSVLYEIQRRDNFRVNIVGPTLIDLSLSDVDGQFSQAQAKVLNVSLGGCMAEVTQLNAPMKLGDIVKGELSAKGYRAFTFEAVVRRYEERIISGIVAKIIGLEFMGLKGHNLSLLNEIVMKCSRESMRAENY